MNSSRRVPCLPTISDNLRFVGGYYYYDGEGSGCVWHCFLGLPSVATVEMAVCVDTQRAMRYLAKGDYGFDDQWSIDLRWSRYTKDEKTANVQALFTYLGMKYLQAKTWVRR